MWPRMLRIAGPTAPRFLCTILVQSMTGANLAQSLLGLVENLDACQGVSRRLLHGVHVGWRCD